jgi:hypothetical protein
MAQKRKRQSILSDVSEKEKPKQLERHPISASFPNYTKHERLALEHSLKTNSSGGDGVAF